MASRLGQSGQDLQPLRQSESVVADLLLEGLAKATALNAPNYYDLAPVLRTSGCATSKHNRYGNDTKQVRQAI